MRFGSLLAGLLLLSFLSSPAPAQRMSIQADPGLRAAAEGSDLPPAFRPLPTPRALVPGRAAIAPATPARPEEFGLLFEYDGARSDLEAAGIRVNSQVGHVFTARARSAEIRNLTAVAGIRNARLARYVQPNLNLAIPDIRANLEHGTPVGIPPVYPGRTGKGVLLGDVDTGVDFNSADFKDPVTGTTRILYLWDQTDAVGPNPSAFTYGTEWTKAQIDASPGTVRQVDDYGHGTNVVGTAAGNGAETGCSQAAYRYVGTAPEASIIEVKTDLSDAGIIDGVNYIFQKAADLGLPCVVNISLGSQFGPHDGSDIFGGTIGALTGPGRIVVASAGNDNSSKIHGKLTTTSNTLGVDKVTLTVSSYTPASGAGNDYFLVSGWYDTSVTAVIRVKGPSASDTLAVGFGGLRDKSLSLTSGKGGKLFVANHNASSGYGGTVKGHQFEIEVYDSLSTSAPRNGTWEIDFVTNTGKPLSKAVHVWIYAASLGASGAVPVVATGLDNTTLVGSPGDADSVFCVAAYVTKNSWFSCAQGGSFSYSGPPVLQSIASFSSPGPRRDGVIKPDISAPGFGVATTHSTQAGSIATDWDADDGVHEMTQGTSFSSPLVAGSVALFLMDRRLATPSLVKAAFEANTRRDGYTGTVPNSSWGWGKLDVYGSIDHRPPAVSVTSPAGGESWAPGSSQALTWTASDSVGVDSIRIEFSADSGATWIPVAANLSNSGTYSWTVPAPPTTRGRIRVTAFDLSRNQAAATSPAFTVSGVVGVGSVGAAFALERNRPNPAPGATSIRFSLPRTEDAELAVFDLAGRRVATLLKGPMLAGSHDVSWNGRGCAAGVYFYRLTAGGQTAVRRMVLVH